MRAKSVFLLMLALGCGLVASIGITQVMAKRNANSAANRAEMSAVFVAIQEIPMGEAVTAKMVKLEPWPKDKIPEGALGKIEDLEERRTKTKIYPGSPILDNYLLTKGASELGAAGQIPPGFRAVGVRVNNVSGGNMIRPADRVDVLVHLAQSPKTQIGETTTRTILQDVKVFAVNDVYDLETTDSSAKIVAQTISLLVTPKQAELVTLAQELGSIRLVMRGPGDNEVVHTSGAQAKALFGLTDSSDRDKESLIKSEPPPKDAGFLDFLNSQQTASSDSTPTASWTIRTIAGSDVNDVMLELAVEDASDQGKGSNFPQWKTTSPTPQSASDKPDAADSSAGETATDAAPETDGEPAPEKAKEM